MKRRCKITVELKGKKYHLMACGKQIWIAAPPSNDWPAIFKDKDLAEDFAKQARQHKLTVDKKRARVHI